MKKNLRKAVAMVSQANPMTLLIGAGVLGAVFLYLTSSSKNAGEAVGKGAVDLAAGVVKGVAIGAWNVATGAASAIADGAGAAVDYTANIVKDTDYNKIVNASEGGDDDAAAAIMAPSAVLGGWFSTMSDMVNSSEGGDVGQWLQ